MSYPIPRDAFDDRLAIVGTAGSGKTYLALGAIEHLLARKARVICIDPLGVMWGLRLCEDGKTASPFQPVIFGGAHGDLPVTEHAGALIGEAVATSRDSCIIDLSQIGTKAGERRFMLAFLTALYRHTDKEPVHLIVDEADMFAPQKLLDKDGDAARLLGMMETVVRRGRVRGFVPWLITQRPAVLSKDVLSQADGVIALKLTASQDRKAIGAWVESTADQGQWKEIDGKLPAFQRGHGIVWIPGRGILREAEFPPKATFDSSRTPKRGEKQHAAELKPIDLGALKERLAAVEAEAKANDPRSLKAEIARLKAEVARKPAPISSSSSAAAKSDAAALRDREAAFNAGIRQGRSEGYPEGWTAGAKRGFSDGVKASLVLSDAILAEAAAMIAQARKVMRPRFEGLTYQAPDAPKKVPERAGPAMKYAPIERQPPGQKVQNYGPGRSDGSLPPGERAVLIAAAQFGGIAREQLTVLTGYKRSSRDAYIQRLREKGYVELQGSVIAVTDAGANALPQDYEPLPTGTDLQAYWLGRLPEGERKILQVLIGAYPNGVSRAEIDNATGYKRSSRDAYLKRMKAKRLWTPDGGKIRASEALF